MVIIVSADSEVDDDSAGDNNEQVAAANTLIFCLFECRAFRLSFTL